VFLLAVMAGLRRREIDTLEWSAFRWERGTIRIGRTKWFHPKSEDSIGDVEVDPELIAEKLALYDSASLSGMEHLTLLVGKQSVASALIRQFGSLKSVVSRLVSKTAAVAFPASSRGP
jgi:hypothetical protein